MGLLQARVELLKNKLDQFTPDELAVLKSICLHHQRTRGELCQEVLFSDATESGTPVIQKEVPLALKLVDGATNKGAVLGLIVNVGGQYTFRPSDDWREYLDDALLATSIVSKKKGQVN